MGNGNKTIQYAIAFAVALASVTMGAISSWPAPVMPKFSNNETNIYITPDDIAWMVSMSSPGSMAGSFLSRFVADRFGRRVTILASALPTMTGMIIVVCATQASLLYVTRFLWGTGCGMLITVISLYLAEIADKEIRGSLTLVTHFMFNFGNLLVMCIGPFVSYSILNYLLLVLPPLYFVACMWIPESPYYWLKEGKVDAARNVLKKIRIYEDEKCLEDDLLRMKADVRNEMRHSSTFKELITGKKYRKAIVIAAGLRTTQILTGQLIISQYLGLIIMESGTYIALSIVFIIFGAVRFCTSVTSSMLADRVGRRPLLIYSYLGTGIFLVLISVYFFCLEVLNVDRDSIKPYSFIPFAGIIASNVISTLGYYSVIVVVPAEIFPLNIKAIAMTCLSVFGGLLNFGIARSYQALKDATGLCGVFIFLGASAVLGCIFTALFVPETKGKSLREIQEQLQGAFYESDETFAKLNPVVDSALSVPEDKELSELNRKTDKNSLVT